MGEKHVIPAAIRYHLAELASVRNLQDSRRSVPKLLEGESRILDVGCGIGQTLLAPELNSAAVRCGVDIDSLAIEYGRSHYPSMDLRVASAEELPFANDSFDLVISRVALPYSDFPEALRQIRRVLRPGGRLWAVLHPWNMERARLFRSLTALAAKNLADSAYVLTNSAILHFFGRSFPRPWSSLHETVQTSAGMHRMLTRIGFDHIQIGRESQFHVEARRR